MNYYGVGVLKMVVPAWKSVCKNMKISNKLNKKASSFWLQNNVKQALQKLVSFAQENKIDKLLAQEAFELYASRLYQKTFRQWYMSFLYSKAHRNKVIQMDIMRSSRLIGQTFYSWKQFHLLKKHLKV